MLLPAGTQIWTFPIEVDTLMSDHLRRVEWASRRAQRHPNLFFEVTLLLGCLTPPPAPVRYRRRQEATHTQALYFLPHAGMPVAYYMRNYYNLSPETMVVYTLMNHEDAVFDAVRRLDRGIADLVSAAYTKLVEAKPCRRPTRPSKG